VSAERHVFFVMRDEVGGGVLGIKEEDGGDQGWSRALGICDKVGCIWTSG
jgi:hypothetical protein